MMRSQRRLKELSAKILDLEAQLVAERAEKEKWEWAAQRAAQDVCDDCYGNKALRELLSRYAAHGREPCEGAEVALYRVRSHKTATL